MPDGPVHVTTTDGASTVLKAGSSARRYTLHGMPGEDFPALPEPDDYVQVPAGYTTDTWAQHLASEGSKIPWAAIGIGAAVIGFLLWRGHR